MRLAVLFSGGKDSIYATFLALRRDRVKYLITMLPESEESWMFHHPCIELTSLQAEALGIEQIKQKTSGEKEKELISLENVLGNVREEIDGVVSGAVASNYQKNRIDEICRKLRLESIAPLWQKNPEQMLREQVQAGFEIIITAVAADGFDKSWIGRKIDAKCVDDLVEFNNKFGISIAGEGGEFETFVCDCPIFKKRVDILDSEIVWDEKTNSGKMIVKNAKLADK